MAVHPSEPLGSLVERQLGPAPGRAGDRSARSWWRCPFHPDKNPSLCVEPGAAHYHCFGCGAHGDAIDLVRRLNPAMGFPEARALVEGRRAPERPPRRAEAPRPEGWQAFARRLVADAEGALWSRRGESARAYLLGRGLNEATIRSARLGLRREEAWVGEIFPEKRVWVPTGIVIPWTDGDEVVMVNVRRPRGEAPKYWAIRGSRRGRAYPSGRVCKPGQPVAIVEGEFEALLLNQEMAGVVPAVTFGSAGDRPDGRALDALLAASPWYVATDADVAGDKAADAWLAGFGRCRRVRPPAPFKDWTEAHQGGVGLRRWWVEFLSGKEAPRLYAWEELLRLPGAARPDGSPVGIVVDTPDPARSRAALEGLLHLPGDADEGPAPSTPPRGPPRAPPGGVAGRAEEPAFSNSD